MGEHKENVDLYYMECSVCNHGITIAHKNYYDFFQNIMTRHGWRLVQDKAGNLKPVCKSCWDNNVYHEEL